MTAARLLGAVQCVGGSAVGSESKSLFGTADVMSPPTGVESVVDVEL